MPPKRKNGSIAESTTARERKKQKVAFARTITIQQPSGAISENAVAGSSKVIVDSLKGLPTVIDVEKFVEARSFEINAMEDAMRNASASSTQRAWQTLPRNLRRRAASHDVRRVPMRLREKARAEMDPVRRKALGRSNPKRGKANQISRTEAFLKRQRDKAWLETHIWHAKRMKMENIWGYRLAIHPTEKAFRPSHRASLHDSIIHDASYYSIIELKGPEKALRVALEACCDPQGPGPGAQRFITGSRTLDTHMYKPGKYPFDLIAPITVMWRPTCPLPNDTQPSVVEDAISAHSLGATRGRKQKGVAKEASISVSSASNEDASRSVWVRSHPTVFDEIFASLQLAASLAVTFVKMAGTEGKDLEIELLDLRGHVNIFEIMGPKSNQVLRGALTPVAEEKRDDFKKFWSSLADVQTSGSIPRGMIIGFKVYDPRLKFPPKNAKPKGHNSTSQVLSQSVLVFPTAVLANCEMWDENIRLSLKTPRFKKKDLDQRRSQNVVPGTALNPLRQDDRVSIILIQRSVEVPSSTESSHIHGWTLIIPSGWSMAFFSSLIYTGTRVGGQRERQTQSFEAGVPYFPRDYPFSEAYNQYARAMADTEKESWERKPPAKRTNYEKIGTRSPWIADWDVVLGLNSPAGNQPRDNLELLTTQREANIATTRDSMRPWLLRGSGVQGVIERAASTRDPGLVVFEEVTRLNAKHAQNLPSPDFNAEDLWKGALVLIRLTMCNRGAPSDLALIYCIDDEEAAKWYKLFKEKTGTVSNLSGDESLNEAELSDPIPPQDSIIGYVTTGNYSLSRGQGFVIGAVPLARLLDVKAQSQRLGVTQFLVKVRDRNGFKSRAAYLELLDT